MKSISLKLTALATVCAMSFSFCACGKSDSDDEDDSSLSSEELEEMIQQDITIEDYDLEEDEDEDDSDTDDEDEDDDDDDDDEVYYYAVVTDEAGEATTDEDGTIVTETVAASSLGEDDMIYAVVTDDEGEATTDEDGTIVTEVVTGTAAEDDEESTLAGKLVWWMDMSDGDLEFNGDFLYVTFKVKDDVEDGAYPIYIGECDFADYSATTITYCTTDGYVLVGDAEEPETETEGDGTIELTCESVSAEAGDEITVCFTMEGNPGIVALIFRFIYDTDVLEYVDFTVGDDAEPYIGLDTT